MAKTEFYDAAVAMGFYGRDEGGLHGKKDYARKFWEDTSSKLMLRPALEALLRQSPRVRVVDLGCGSGEGLHLITHVPVSNAVRQRDRTFVAGEENLGCYIGVDISAGMVAQGRRNFADRPFVRFEQADLARGFPLTEEPSFDLYFSSYGSFSHLSEVELTRLVGDIARHTDKPAFVVLDLLGRFSPEWPQYWTRGSGEFLEYHMGYLVDRAAVAEVERFRCTFWSGDDVRRVATHASEQAGVAVRVCDLRDRSILIGRHMEMGTFNATPRPYRSLINQLFHQDYRSDLSNLIADLPMLDSFRLTHGTQAARIDGYCRDWNVVVRLVRSLMDRDDAAVRGAIESSSGMLAEDLRMLAWLHRNADRFPVVDFWASVMGPQVACVLRNLECSLPEGLGCGHGLLALLAVRGAERLLAT